MLRDSCGLCVFTRALPFLPFGPFLASPVRIDMDDHLIQVLDLILQAEFDRLGDPVSFNHGQ